MKTLWKDVKQSIYNMMALDLSEYKEYEKKIINAVNYALIEVAKDFAMIKEFKINQLKEDEAGYNIYDMYELTRENGEDIFLGFAADAPLFKRSEKGLELISDFTIIADRYLYLNKQDAGEFVVNYRVYPKKITAATNEDDEIDLTEDALNLVAVLATWRIFIDDDLTRASMYYNEYQDLRERLNSKKGFYSAVKILGGVDI